MSQSEPPSGVDALVDHLVHCRTDVTHVVAVDGSADGIVARLLDQGWTFAADTEVVAGKRIRTLRPPEPPVPASPDLGEPPCSTLESSPPSSPDST